MREELQFLQFGSARPSPRAYAHSLLLKGEQTGRGCYLKVVTSHCVAPWFGFLLPSSSLRFRSDEVDSGLEMQSVLQVNITRR